MFVHRCQLLKYLNCDSVANERDSMFLNVVYILYLELGIMARWFAAVVNILCKIIILSTPTRGDSTAAVEVAVFLAYDLYSVQYTGVQINKLHYIIILM